MVTTDYRPMNQEDRQTDTHTHTPDFVRMSLVEAQGYLLRGAGVPRVTRPDPGAGASEDIP